MKYILPILLLSTQLFPYEYNKPISIYGYVSEQVIDSSETKKKENYYISNTYHIDGKGVKNIPLLLLVDNNKTNLTIPLDQLNKQYKLKGIIVKGRYKHQGYTLDVFKVTSIEKRHGKIKVASYLNNFAKVKLMVISPMAGKEEAKRKKIDIDYIRNIKLKADDKLIYNVNLSPCISEDPLLKFSYTDIKPISLTFEYTDNNGIIKRNTKKVKHINRIREFSKKLKMLKMLLNPKSYPNQIMSIKELFGDITLIEDGIKLTAPKLVERGNNVPVRIHSKIKFKSVALFIKSKGYFYKNDNDLSKDIDGFKLVSQWFSTPYSIIDFHIRIKTEFGISELVVVLEAEDGKFYTIKKEVEHSRGCVNAGG